MCIYLWEFIHGKGDKDDENASDDWDNGDEDDHEESNDDDDCAHDEDDDCADDHVMMIMMMLLMEVPSEPSLDNRDRISSSSFDIPFLEFTVLDLNNTEVPLLEGK